jgi:hypothetical protein
MLFPFDMKFLLPILASIVFLPYRGLAETPTTIKEYYYRLPADQYTPAHGVEGASQETSLQDYRKSLIAIEDTKNAYLKLQGAWEGWAEFVLFRKRDGSDVIAESSVHCGPVCEGELTLSTYQNGTWAKVEKKIFPSFSQRALDAAFKSKEIDPGEHPSYYFILLPQEKAIHIACNLCKDDKPVTLLELLWDGEKFSEHHN